VQAHSQSHGFDTALYKLVASVVSQAVTSPQRHKLNSLVIGFTCTADSVKRLSGLVTYLRHGAVIDADRVWKNDYVTAFTVLAMEPSGKRKKVPRPGFPILRIPILQKSYQKEN
jgi:hypothetical protein